MKFITTHSLLSKILALLLLLSLVPAQAKEQLSDIETRSLLRQVTLQSILPIYRELDNNAQNLVTTTRQFCDGPNERGLNKVRETWSETLSSWQRASPLLFGPATEDSIDFTIYFRPIKKAVINGFLNKIKADSTFSIDKEAVDLSGVGGQGLAALEYLLFDRKQADIAILSAYTDSKTGKQRCEYIVAIEELLASNVNTIVEAWEPDSGNYSEAFYTAGDGSAHFTKAYQPIELLVNRLYQAIQAVEIKQLGVPLGLQGSRTGKMQVYPYKLEAWRSGHSLQNVMSVLQGFKRLLVDGGILEVLKKNKHKALALELEEQMNKILASKFKSEDLFQLLKEPSAEVTIFHMQIKEFAGTIGSGLAPVLGVQLGFNQNDGD